MISFPNKKYNIIYADPPWSYGMKMTYAGTHGQVTGADYHYKTMTIQDIKNMPVQNITNENCYLFMWVTMPFLNKGLDVMSSWGFNYKTCGFTWIKKTKNNKLHCGLGHYTRGNAELCLLGVKGRLKRLNTSVYQVIESKIERHSKKPDEVRDRIVSLYGDLPRIELFARQKVKGWDCWGNEV
tara:strand:+ start:736 stop:1284 length:549 start_codon:yes stop_codon:yes gene_type:complete